MARQSSGDWQQSVREAGPYLGLGLQLAVSVALCTGGGYYADQQLGTMPWLTLGGAMLGMVTVVAQIVKVSRQMSGRSDAASKRTSGARTSSKKAGSSKQNAAPDEHRSP